MSDGGEEAYEYGSDADEYNYSDEGENQEEGDDAALPRFLKARKLDANSTSSDPTTPRTMRFGVDRRRRQR